MPLDLLVADLLPSAPGSPRLRSLEKWLARADIQRDAGGAAGFLARAFGQPALAVAALERLAEGAPQGACMRADPVYLRVQGDELRLYDASVLDVTGEEARQLAQALQAHFAVDGLEFVVSAPHRWYVRMGAGDAPRTTALDDAVGRNVFGLLPEDSKWRSAMTEAQMILAAHEVNARRESEGKPAINSVWFWGGGPLPPADAKPYASIYADDPLARGLARWSGAQLHAVPTGIAALDLARASDSILAMVPASAGLDENWFGPLAGAIDRFDRVRLILPSPGSTLVATLTGSARWRWFRPGRPLSAYA